MKEKKMDEAQIAELLQKAGPRALPDQIVHDQIKVNVKQAWLAEVKISQQKYNAKKRKVGLYALAASLVMAVAITVSIPEEPQATEFAELNWSTVKPEIKNNSGEWVPLDNPHFSHAIDIRTQNNNYARLDFNNGFVVRLAENTQIRLNDSNNITLESGAIYLDSHQDEVAGIKNHETDNFVVTTPFGIATDIGTQFEVRVNPKSLQIQVREGQVEVSSDQAQLLINEGERVLVSEQNKPINSRITKHDQSWQWTQNISEPFKLEGASLDSYLQWLSDETGKRIKYLSETTQKDAKKTILHGTMSSSNGRTPIESLTVVMPTTDFYVADSSKVELTIESKLGSGNNTNSAYIFIGHK